MSTDGARAMALAAIAFAMACVTLGHARQQTACLLAAPGFDRISDGIVPCWAIIGRDPHRARVHAKISPQ